MGTEQNVGKQARRRGRPPGSRKGTSSQQVLPKRAKREKENTTEVSPNKRSGDEDQLTYAIDRPFPGVLEASPPIISEIQKDIYHRVLELVATTTAADARLWQVSEAIFEYALLHLDPQRQGLAITYAGLMPPYEDGIHSLREVAMRGNYPWPTLLD